MKKTIFFSGVLIQALFLSSLSALFFDVPMPVEWNPGQKDIQMIAATGLFSSLCFYLAAGLQVWWKSKEKPGTVYALYEVHLQKRMLIAYTLDAAMAESWLNRDEDTESKVKREVSSLPITHELSNVNTIA